MAQFTKQDMNEAAARLQRAATIDELRSALEEAPVKALLAHSEQGAAWKSWVTTRREVLEALVEPEAPAPPSDDVAVPVKDEVPVAGELPAAKPATATAKAATAAEPTKTGMDSKIDIFALADIISKGRRELNDVRNDKWKEIVAEAKRQSVYVNMTQRVPDIGVVGHYLVDRLLDSEPITVEQAVEEAIEMGWTSQLERDYDQATYEALMCELDLRNLFLHPHAKMMVDGSVVTVNLISKVCQAIESGQLKTPTDAVDFAVKNSWAVPKRGNDDDESGGASGAKVHEILEAKGGSPASRGDTKSRKR